MLLDSRREIVVIYYGSELKGILDEIITTNNDHVTDFV